MRKASNFQEDSSGHASSIPRERRRERAPGAELGFDPNPTAMAFDDLFGEREPEPEAALRIAGATPKAFEKVWNVS